jgi:hypothetical protein
VLLFACVPSFLTLWMIDSYNRPEILKYPFKNQWKTFSTWLKFVH